MNVLTHRNVIAGAFSILLLSIYPAAPETMHPTASPIIIETFLRKGEPNSSVKMILMNVRKPRPMNSGDPHLARITTSQPLYVSS